jgi:hypothetical protein
MLQRRQLGMAALNPAYPVLAVHLAGGTSDWCNQPAILVGYRLAGSR